MNTTYLEMLPAEGDAQQLMVLLHGVGDRAEGLRPLGEWLQQQFPQAAIVLMNGYDAFDGGGAGRQWFSVMGAVEAERPARVAAVRPRLIDDIRHHQRRLGVGEAATALVGFSQGAIMALEAVAAVDGLAGRVLAFSGRYATLPATAPQQTTLHFFHGGADPVISAQHARAAVEHLATLEGADATLDIAERIGHQIHPAMLDCALNRLTRHIPLRTWRSALGGVAAAASPGGGDQMH